MTAVDVPGLRDLAEAATPGPWETYTTSGGAAGVTAVGYRIAYKMLPERTSPTQMLADFAHIAAFGPETALRLLGVAEAVERLCDEAPTHSDWGWRQVVSADQIRDVLAALR